MLNQSQFFDNFNKVTKFLVKLIKEKEDTNYQYKE